MAFCELEKLQMPRSIWTKARCFCFPFGRVTSPIPPYRWRSSDLQMRREANHLLPKSHRIPHPGLNAIDPLDASLLNTGFIPHCSVYDLTGRSSIPWISRRFFWLSPFEWCRSTVRILPKWHCKWHCKWQKMTKKTEWPWKSWKYHTMSKHHKWSPEAGQGDGIA